MDKSRELYSKEKDNSSKFEGKTVAWEHTSLYLASVRRPRTLIAIWTFVSCVRGLLSPASLKMRARATLEGVVLLLPISAYKIIQASTDWSPSQNEWYIYPVVLYFLLIMSHKM